MKTAKAGDLRTLKTNSQGRDLRTLKEPVERCGALRKSEKKRSGRRRRRR